MTINRTAGTASLGGIWVSDTIIATGGGSNFDSWISDPDNDPTTAPVPYSPSWRVMLALVRAMGLAPTGLVTATLTVPT